MIDQLSTFASDCVASLSDYAPVITHLSPVTMVGIAVAAAATLFYLVTRTPELLLVIFTAMLYAAAPLIPRLA